MFGTGFPPDAEMARLTARMLLEIKAVHFRADEPYKLTSGLASPVYIDCRKLISYPAVRASLMDFACAKILRDAGFARFDAVAGGETAGIPFAAWIAERLALPMLYVRKKPKGFGRDAQIEGALAEGARVLLVEDLTTDGGSKNPLRRGPAHGRRRGRPYLRHLLLRHLRRGSGHPRPPRPRAPPPRHLAGRPRRGARRPGLRRPDPRRRRGVPRRPPPLVRRQRRRRGDRPLTR